METTFFNTFNHNGTTFANAGSLEELAAGLGLTVVSVGEWHRTGPGADWELFNTAVLSNGATVNGNTEEDGSEGWGGFWR